MNGAEPSRRATAKLWSAEQGDRFWRCVEWPCRTCNGGEDRPLVTEFDDDHGYVSEYHCRDCENEGFSYGTRAGDPELTRAEIPCDPNVIAAFAPLPLAACADAVLNLRGAA